VVGHVVLLVDQREGRVVAAHALHGRLQRGGGVRVKNGVEQETSRKKAGSKQEANRNRKQTESEQKENTNKKVNSKKTQTES
jgi:hypothetical protein